jgi:hypothetical protein
VRFCQQVFSAAFIARVELGPIEESTKNELCAVVPHPDNDSDYFSATLGNLLNAARWNADPDLARWLMESRLDGFSELGRAPAEPWPEEQMMQIVDKLERFAGRRA